MSVSIKEQVNYQQNYGHVCRIVQEELACPPRVFEARKMVMDHLADFWCERFWRCLWKWK